MSIDNLTASVQTPAFVYDEGRILEVIRKLENILGETNCSILFSLKSFAIIDALYSMAPSINGFSCSSLFESMLAREILGENGTVHVTTPGLRPNEIIPISELCDYISFNSVSQWLRYQQKITSKINCGLRINPQMSFVTDDRYNPCRSYSKLGIPLDQLTNFINDDLKSLKSINGLHFHTNCESTDFEHLFLTTKHIDKSLSKVLSKLDWINIGGGYLFDEIQNLDKLNETLLFLRNNYDLNIFFEPGKGIIGDAGYMISTVIDLFESDGQDIAILDTTTNHMPEVFEYQFKPEIFQESSKGKYVYMIAGSTCLAGDFFGVYKFDEPLQIGSKIVFEDMGAYTMVKANMFNGINLPSIYALTKDGEIVLKKQFEYGEYKSRCGE